MSTLHLLSHSPFNDNRFSSCLPLLGPGDALLLSGDAVHALQSDSNPLMKLRSLPGEVAVYALQEDLLARGLHTLPESVEAIDYATFVELCIRYTRVNSWL